jgi:hypothetical protein
MATGKEKSKWPEKNLPQYNTHANYPGIESGRGEKQRTNRCYGITIGKYYERTQQNYVIHLSLASCIKFFFGSKTVYVLGNGVSSSTSVGVDVS